VADGGVKKGMGNHNKQKKRQKGSGTGQTSNHENDIRGVKGRTMFRKAEKSRKNNSD